MSNEGHGDDDSRDGSWQPADIGQAAPCEVCGSPGFVIYTHPSLGPQSDIRALCQNHAPEDDYT